MLIEVVSKNESGSESVTHPEGAEAARWQETLRAARRVIGYHASNTDEIPVQRDGDRSERAPTIDGAPSN